MKNNSRNYRFSLPAILLLTLMPVGLTACTQTTNPADSSGRWVSIVMGIVLLLAYLGLMIYLWRVGKLSTWFNAGITAFRLKTQGARLKGELARGKLDDVLAVGMRTINGTKAIAVVLDGADAGMLRESLDNVKAKLGSGVALLATVSEGKVSLIAGVTKDLKYLVMSDPNSGSSKAEKARKYGTKCIDEAEFSRIVEAAIKA